MLRGSTILERLGDRGWEQHDDFILADVGGARVSIRLCFRD